MESPVPDVKVLRLHRKCSARTKSYSGHEQWGQNGVPCPRWVEVDGKVATIERRAFSSWRVAVDFAGLNGLASPALACR
jgi:hypothetical protein